MKLIRALFGSWPSLMAAGAARGLAMSPADLKAEALRNDIARHDELYFRAAAPDLSDAAYDEMKRELAQHEKAREVGSRRPETIGDDRSGGARTFVHHEPMLSLEKAHSEAEVRAACARMARELGEDNVTCVVEPKFDGVAVSVTYDHGRLVRAVTRGNGHEGDDITASVLAIASLPHELREPTPRSTGVGIPALVELRGEAYLPLAEFARLNRERAAAGEAPYAHPRNLAAATLKQLDHAVVTERQLAVVFYGMGECEPAAIAPASQRGLHEAIRAWGLPGVATWSVARNADEVWTAIKEQSRLREGAGFPADGVVVKVDDMESRRVLGENSHAPRWAVAFKFSPERAVTRLRGISLQVGRTGVLTPVAEFDPVCLGGATVTQASLHNRAEIEREDLRVGDFVTVEKAGDVIPTLAGVDKSRRPSGTAPFVFPIHCPSCRSALVEEGAATRCLNGQCPAQLRRRIQHFVSEAGVNIVGLGPTRIEILIARAGVKGIADLYRLRREDLTGAVAELGGAKMVEHLLDAIARSKTAELWRFINGLGIPHVGIAAARELARHCDGLQALARLVQPPAIEEADSPVLLRPVVVAALKSYFNDARHRELIADLVALGVRPRSAREPTTALAAQERRE